VTLYQPGSAFANYVSAQIYINAGARLMAECKLGAYASLELGVVYLTFAA
jgi:hypothetical protein